MYSIFLAVGFLKHQRLLKVLCFDFRNIGFLGVSHLLDARAWPKLKEIWSLVGYGEATVVFNELHDWKFEIF